MDNKLIQKNKIKKENKLSLSKRKDNTVHSLFEVEYFLTNFQKLLKTIKFYKLLK